MFYISKIAPSGYYVMDTDDGVEEKLTISEIKDIVLNRGIEIAGVDVEIKKTRTGLRRVVKGVSVYIPEKGTVTTKMSVLFGLRYQVNDEGMLTLLENDFDRSAPLSLRLSDCCRGLADYCLGNLSNVTLIFDDKLKCVTNKSISGIGSYSNFICDVTEVTRDDILTIVYNMRVAKKTYNTDRLVVNRSPLANNYYTEAKLLQNTYLNSSNLPKFSHEAHEFFLARHKKRLLKKLSVDIKLKTLRHSYTPSMKVIMRRLASLQDILGLDKQHLLECLRNDSVERIRCTNVSECVLNTVANYIKYGGTDADIIDTYIKVYRKFVTLYMNKLSEDMKAKKFVEGREF